MRQVGDDRRSHHGPPGIVPAEKEPTMDFGFGYIPAFFILLAVVWAIRLLAAAGRSASEAFNNRKQDSQR
jgi:hypothetical protein